MVAYSFKRLFVPAIEAGTKRQTIRGPRKRHARVGEPVQLYQGMRTSHCRRILVPDPICTAVRHVALEVVAPCRIASVAVDDEDAAGFVWKQGYPLLCGGQSPFFPMVFPV